MKDFNWCNFEWDKRVFPDPKGMINRLKELQEAYNVTKDKEDYLRLLYSTPSGLLMTGRVTTNYLQLMNIVQQRKNHRLPEWRQFCQQVIDELPLFKELLIANGIIKGIFFTIDSVTVNPPGFEIITSQ